MTTTGETLADRFTMEGVIGEGGFATVYRAVDQTTNTAVALKLLHVPKHAPHYAETIARFHREVAIVAKLRDPHTVQYVAHGEVDGQPWVAFELLDGEDLADVLARSGTLPPAQVAAIVRQILLAVREAHQYGLIHRDLKPSNIRVLPGSRIKVLDFGIARTETEEDARCRSRSAGPQP